MGGIEVWAADWFWGINVAICLGAGGLVRVGPPNRGLMEGTCTGGFGLNCLIRKSMIS